MNRLRAFFDSPSGKGVAIALIVLALATLYFSIRGQLRNDIAAASRQRMFVCAETFRAFPHEVRIGDAIPVTSPFTGNPTGYEADEMCYWTAEGTIKDEPTYVLLNSTLGRDGPTYCHDCNRLVIRNNPPPVPGAPPPPTAGG